MAKKPKGWAMKEEKERNQARKRRIAARQKPHGGAKMRLEKQRNKARRKRNRAPKVRYPPAPSVRL